MSFDPLAHDLPDYDPLHPPLTESITFPSAGETLLGLLHIAQGPGPHPTLILLHGFPGNERSLDLAHSLRRAGWNVLFFSYRGAWGSSGAFSFHNVLEDVESAIAFVRSPAGTALRCDPARVVLLGQSMGGWAALMTAARRHDLLGVAATAPWNISLFALMTQVAPSATQAAIAWMQSSTRALRGTDGESLYAEVQAFGEAGDLVQLAPRLASQRLLIVAAGADSDLPNGLYHEPLIAALEAAGAQHLSHHIIPDADHSFAARRVALARTILHWLDTLLDRGD
jgi:uncharacterized protein